jgi:L-ribulose-5-phosphate 3-epimerase
MFKRAVTTALLGLTAIMTISGCAGPKGGKGPHGKDGKMMPHWHLAMMGYTFREFPLFEGIDKTQSLGLKYLEEFSWHKVGGPYGDAQFNDTASPEVRAGVKLKLKESGMKLVGYYSHELDKGEAATRPIFEFCKEMGVQYIVSEPDPKNLDMIEKMADHYGINVAIHNHPKDPKHPEYTNWNPDEVLKLLEGRGKRMGVCADVGHWGRSGLDPVECIKKCKGRIISLHLKDVAKAEPGSPDVVWGTGICNISGVLAELAHQKFKGTFAIEYEAHPADNMTEVAECIKYFNQISNELAH